MSIGGPKPVPAPERQFSLMLALLMTRSGLTKAHVYASVHGYRRAFEQSGQTAALDKMFERDKAELRDLGLTLETFDDPSAPGDNQLTRYRIPNTASPFPAGTTLDADEVLLLSLAAAVWREGSLSGESRRGLMKLRSLGVEVGEERAALVPRWRSRDAAFEPLAAAIDTGRIVEFRYLRPGDDAARLRHVEPLALVRHEGRWLLGAYDLDREDERTFLLSRVLGGIRKGGPIDEERATVAAREDQAERFLRRLQEFATQNSALLDVRPGGDAEQRLAKRGTLTAAAPTSWGRVELHYTDLDLLADELAAFGPEVRVVGPTELHDAVVSRLRRALENHGSDA
ncbi:proteasome accessory factor B [Pseudoclavibacter chungangensis]|nr:WYL domain-containing protein [Pseudoclavibacter chungangensis]NYJ66707.1 proteasome accessory factor B [Pseudoclavibacter chungangensis]